MIEKGLAKSKRRHGPRNLVVWYCLGLGASCHLATVVLLSYKQGQTYSFDHSLKEKAGDISTASSALLSDDRGEPVSDKSRHAKESIALSGNNNNSTGSDSLDVKFFGKDTEEQKCALSTEIITFLACGNDGHVFAATMVCSNSVNRTIALKVMRREHDQSNEKQSWFVSETATTLKAEEEIYKALFSNTTRNERKRFAISIGTARITPKLLVNAVLNYKEGSQSQIREICLRVLPSFANATIIDYETPVIGSVYEFAQGKSIEKHKLISNDERRHVAAELVCMYRHMYERKILHDDISTSHLMYDDVEKGVTLVDFSRVNIFHDRRHNDEEVQQLQLMTLIANVCTKSKGGRHFPVPNRASDVKRHLERLGHMKHDLTIAMEQCSLSNQTSLTSDLLENNYTTEKKYEIFSKWSGGCE